MLYLIIWFITVLFSAHGNEVKESEAEIFKEFCKLINVEISAYPYCKMSTITVNFQIINSTHIGCYRFFKIYLTNDTAIIDSFKVEYDDVKNKASHEFANLTFGVYDIYIRPICPNCPLLLINGSSVDMSRDYCILPEKPPNELSYQRIVIITAVTSTILLLMISGLVYIAGRRKHCKDRFPDPVDDKNHINIEVDKTALNTEIYIFHFYDRNEIIKKKVEIVKDFLLKFSYFSSVKGIDDELPAILFDVNDWLNDVLEERGKDGTLRRIILITSQVENEPDDDEKIENLIFAAFIKKLNNDIERCLSGYDNLFVVQLDGSLTHSEKLKDIVRRDRYSLSGESMQDHMIDLCLNLCSGLKLDMCDVEERITELLLKHPLRHLGNCVDVTEYV